MGNNRGPYSHTLKRIHSHIICPQKAHPNQRAAVWSKNEMLAKLTASKEVAHAYTYESPPAPELKLKLRGPPVNTGRAQKVLHAYVTRWIEEQLERCS